jgi:uncharacterized protein with FMN-binding domain
VRRAIVALLGTATGTVLLVGAKGGFSQPAGPGTVPLADEPASATPSRAPSAAVPSAAPSADPSAAASPKASPTKRATPTKAARPGLRDGTWNGSRAANEYGTVELAIVVAGGRITDVKVLDSPDSHSRSRQINSRALPQLRTETLAAQSAAIDTITGATTTSESYRQSLQAAIDLAHA